MKKKYIQLPKGYISYSQIQLWKADPIRYKAIYFDDRVEFRTTNKGMEYGKAVATALEQGAETGDLLTDTAMSLLPKYDIADKEIVADLKTKGGWIKILGKPDSMDSKTKSFFEFKTGKTKWNAIKAQMHPQMAFYGMLIWLAYKVVPEECALVWIETEMLTEATLDGTIIQKGIKPTGRVERYPVKITLSKILDTMAETSRVAREIELAFASHITNPELINW